MKRENTVPLGGWQRQLRGRRWRARRGRRPARRGNRAAPLRQNDVHTHIKRPHGDPMKQGQPHLRRATPTLTALLTLAALLLLAPTPAHAAAHAAVDFDLGAPIGQRYFRYGTALGARFGWRFDLGPVWLQPEAGASFVTFKEAAISHMSGQPLDLPRLVGGARLGLGPRRLVQPAFYAHAGIGWRENVARGPAADLGLALDLAPVPHFTVGAQLGYNVLSATLPRHPGTVIMTPGGPVTIPAPTPAPSAIQWISAGIHGGFTF